MEDYRMMMITEKEVKYLLRELVEKEPPVENFDQRARNDLLNKLYDTKYRFEKPA